MKNTPHREAEGPVRRVDRDVGAERCAGHHADRQEQRHGPVDVPEQRVGDQRGNREDGDRDEARRHRFLLTQMQQAGEHRHEDDPTADSEEAGHESGGCPDDGQSTARSIWVAGTGWVFRTIVAVGVGPRRAPARRLRHRGPHRECGLDAAEQQQARGEDHQQMGVHMVGDFGAGRWPGPLRSPRTRARCAR